MNESKTYTDLVNALFQKSNEIWCFKDPNKIYDTNIGYVIIAENLEIAIEIANTTDQIESAEDENKWGKDYIEKELIGYSKKSSGVVMRYYYAG